MNGVLSCPEALPDGLGVEQPDAREQWLAAAVPGDLVLRAVPGPAQSDTPEWDCESPSSAFDDEFGPQPCAVDGLPDASVWAERFVQAVLDVLAGRRPHRQLARWANAGVFTTVGLLSSQASARRSVRRNPSRHVVRSVRVQRVGDNAVEAAVVVRGQRRCRAVALRFEALDGRWQCTALEMV